MRIQQFDFSLDLLQSLIWSVDQSTNIVGLITAKQEWYDINQTKFWSDWFNNVFNLLTANDFGLSVWSRILNAPYYVANDPEPDFQLTFGFNEKNEDGTFINRNQNFEQGNFHAEEPALTLTTEEQRFFLRLLFYKYSTRCAVTGLNQFLDYLIKTSEIGYYGKLYALDGLDMTMTYVFTLPGFSDNLLQAIKDNDAFPRPTGVEILYYFDDYVGFGFNDFDVEGNLINNNQNFENGNFYNDTE